MSEYGVRIFNYQAASIYEYNLGFRNYMDTKPAMLTNSLFSDFIRENGMQVSDAGSTRDIVCLEFGYGSKSFERKLKDLKREIRKKKREFRASRDGPLEEEILEMEKKKDELESKASEFDISKQDLRIMYYVNGVDIKHLYKNKDGTKTEELIHYKMLFRTPGKAKKGTVMFIRQELFDVASDFLRMGIKLPETNTPIVEIGAYSSLSTSSIVAKIKIEPENILFIKDVDSYFKTRAVSIEIDEARHCYAKTLDDYEMKNTMFDGQALIDSSIFPNWGDGYILLRHHFCKMAAFCTNIQLFFKDYFGEDYEDAVLTDMFGHEHKASDIKLITTENAVKWLKFNISYEYWCKRVWQNGAMFGIVKTAHRSKLGNVQQMSYQMVNSLDMDSMEDVVKPTLEYIEKLKNDEIAFLNYLKDNVNFSNDYDVLISLVEQDGDFTHSQYFKDRKYKIIKDYIEHIKYGKLIQNADNLTIVGSPYAMLLHSVGEDVENDDTFQQEDCATQCYTGRFADGEYLAGFRNPFNSRNNLDYLHNVYNEKIGRYFKLGEMIIAVNLLHTDFQNRNNGLVYLARLNGNILQKLFGENWKAKWLL